MYLGFVKTCYEHVISNIFAQGSDELWSGYLYYGDCHDPAQLQEENRRILKSVQFANLQRCDRQSYQFRVIHRYIIWLLILCSNPLFYKIFFLMIFFIYICINEFIRCFYQFFPRIFLSLKQLKNKTNFLLVQKINFSVCQLKKKSYYGYLF